MLVAARNTTQHEPDQKNKPILQETFVPQRLLVAIPAGFEPATHGVEIRYSRWVPILLQSWVREALKITVTIQSADNPAPSSQAIAIIEIADNGSNLSD
jgi:hypothetical protein